MVFKVRFAELRDLNFCIKHDYKNLKETIVKRKIEEHAIIISEIDGKPIGYLRVEYLWLTIPYVGLITVNKKYRNKGVGTTMITFLEKHLHKQGHTYLYSSSQANEPDSQSWHRKTGFKECGYIAGINEGEIGEIFFRKVISVA